MAGFAYKTPQTEADEISLRELNQLAKDAIGLAHEIGLYINGQDGSIFFRDLNEALKRSVR